MVAGPRNQTLMIQGTQRRVPFVLYADCCPPAKKEN